MSLVLRFVACVLVLVLMVAGCGGHDGHKAAVAEDHAHEDTPGEPREVGLSLTLDGGERWTMDDHTRLMFAQMAGRFEGFEPASVAQEDLVAMGIDLRGDIDELIAGCTMTGAAHDELHKYLVAYIPAVEALKNDGALTSAKKVHGLLQGYPEFFQ